MTLPRDKQKYPPEDLPVWTHEQIELLAQLALPDHLLADIEDLAPEVYAAHPHHAAYALAQKAIEQAKKEGFSEHYPIVLAVCHDSMQKKDVAS